MKKVLPLLLCLCLSACGTFRVDIQVGPKATSTLTAQPTTPATVTHTAILALASPTPSQMPTATRTRLPATPTLTLEPAATATATLPPPPTLTPLPVDSDDPAFPALPSLIAGQAITLTTVQMMDETTGWGLELKGHLVRTVDGGFTWHPVTPPRGRYQTGGLFALNTQIAWASPYNLEALCAGTPADCPEDPAPVRNGVIWRTDNGGNTWQPSHPFSLAGRDGDTSNVQFYRPVAMYFLDARTGWLLVNVNHQMNQDHYRLYQTLDGGDTWSRLADHQFGPYFCTVQGIGFRDTRTGWIAGHCVGWGIQNEPRWGVYQTTDGGRTWTWVALPAPYDLPDGFFRYAYECGVNAVDIIPPVSVGLEMACALRDKASGYSPYTFYYLSLNGSQQWRSWQVNGTAGFLNQDTGWQFSLTAAGSYDLERTVDGAQTWTLLKTVWWHGAPDFVSEQVGWVIAHLGEDTTLLKTTDGGQNWVEIKTYVAR